MKGWRLMNNYLVTVRYGNRERVIKRRASNYREAEKYLIDNLPEGWEVVNKEQDDMKKGYIIFREIDKLVETLMDEAGEDTFAHLQDIKYLTHGIDEGKPELIVAVIQLTQRREIRDLAKRILESGL